MTVEAVSSRADMVTGGDVLIEVVPGAATGDDDPAEAFDYEQVDSVTVDGKAAEVAWSKHGDRVTGLVSGLPVGESTIEVVAGGDSASLEVTNHSEQGPVFSGEQLPMVTCTTEQFGMAPSEPPGCLADPVVQYSYLDGVGNQVFVEDPLDPASVPDDAQTVEIDGVQQPALLRTEAVVLDRGVTTITTLAGASMIGAGVGDEFDSEHWNGRLVYRFGGGCGTTYSQGFNLFDAPSLDLLADGYAFATNTLNTFQVQCQDIVSAEAAMITKEYFSEHYGVPEVTIGEGGSGGAIQQFLIAQNYPGILDAIAPTSPFPDAMSIAPGVLDCALLANYYASDQGRELTAEQQQAVNGHMSGLSCVLWGQTFVPVADPAKCGFGDAVGGAASALPGLSGGLPTVPEGQPYDPETNPDGLRCTMQDSYPQVFERDPETGFAERPIDNTGVQYGLKALNEGVIDPDQFLSLNEFVGGLDLDANPIPERMVADEAAIERLYETGRITSGGALLDIPIIVTNTYTDPGGDIHDRFRMFSMNERLRTDSGDQAPGYVMWTRPPSAGSSITEQLAGTGGSGTRATRLLDEWATALAADDSEAPIAERLAATRPDEAVNTCFDEDGAVVEAGADVYDADAPCAQEYPLHDDPRTAAGAPLANNIAKCTLQSVTEALEGGVYEVEFTDAQIERLESIFPDGVCDWTVAGVGQVPLGKPWRSFD
ncbi:MAG: DUF6351 family protein [Microthrixaceae bacterium]